MVISKKNERKLLNSLFCKPLPMYLKIIIILGIMILPNLFNKSERLLDPLLFFMAPAWTLYVYKYILPVLRYPRKSEWHAVLSISYSCRKYLAKVFVKNKIIEGMILQTIGLFLFSLLYIIAFDIKKYNDISLQIAYISYANTWLSSVFLLVITYFTEYMIDRKDFKKDFQIKHYKVKSLFTWKNKIDYIVSSILSYIFPKPYHSLIKRRWLYLFRSDIIATIISIFGAPFFATLSAIYLNQTMPTGSVYLIIYTPFIVLFYLTANISHSNVYFFNLPYYGVVKRTRYLSNLIFSCYLTLPYIICFLFISMFLTQKDSFQIISGILSFFNMILVYTYRWGYEKWSNFSKLLLIITFFVCLISNTNNVENTFFIHIIAPIVLMIILISFCSEKILEYLERIF